VRECDRSCRCEIHELDFGHWAHHYYPYIECVSMCSTSVRSLFCQNPTIQFIPQVTIPMLRGFGIGNTAETSAQLDIAFKVRGALPLGGGVVEFRCPVIQNITTC